MPPGTGVGVYVASGTFLGIASRSRVCMRPARHCEGHGTIHSLTDGIEVLGIGIMPNSQVNGRNIEQGAVFFGAAWPSPLRPVWQEGL